MKAAKSIRTWLWVTLVVCPLFAFAQEESKLVLLWNKLQERMDSSAVRKVDQKYIEVPKNPWRVVLRGKVDEFNMRIDSYIDENYVMEKMNDEASEGRFDWRQTYNPPMAQSVGFFVGYRGLGFSYSYYLRKKTGRTISFSSTGARYGLNFRLRRFSTHDVTIDGVLNTEDQTPTEFHVSGAASTPMWIRSVIVDGYYLFNGRRFSQAAAYNQSVVQKRSSGSLMLGATYHQSSLDMADRQHALLIQMNGDWGKFSIRQFNIGLGYGYNWVPGRGWLLNIMLMPTISTYNRVKTHYYDSNYSIWAEFLNDDHKPLPNDPYDQSWRDDVEIWETKTETRHGKMQLNADARASITYTWNRYFVNVFGQLNRFDYGYTRSDVKLTDWYVRGALGVRF